MQVGLHRNPPQMYCRDISRELFETVADELTVYESQDGEIETVTGHHEDYGFTILARDATKCIMLWADPAGLRALAWGALA